MAEGTVTAAEQWPRVAGERGLRNHAIPRITKRTSSRTSGFRHLLGVVLILSGIFSAREAEADFRFKKGTFQKTTTVAPPDQDQAVIGVGFQPKAVIFYAANLLIGSTGGTSVRVTYGFATGPANQGAIGIAADNDVSVGDSVNQQSQSKCIVMVYDSTPELRAQAQLKSFDPDGFTVTWTVSDAFASVVHYIALGGTDLTNALASSFTPTTGAGTQAVTVGFRPHFLMFLSIDHAAMDVTYTDFAQASIGFASWPSGQGGVGVALTPTGAAPDTYVRQRTDNAIVELTGTGGEDMLAAVQSFDTNGFTINKTASVDTTPILYLALKGGRYKVGNFNKRTSAGSQTVSGVGFQPLGLILASKDLPSNTAIEPQGRISFGSSDLVTEGAMWFHELDGGCTTIPVPATGNCTAIGNSTARRRQSETQVTEYGRVNGDGSYTRTGAADVTSFNADGFTLNWTTSDAAADEHLYAAFGAGTTAVTLQSFEARGAGGVVDLLWETGSELNNLGFHLYRSTSADGPYERITASVIPGLGSSPEGASYSYRDAGLVNGVTYFYRLEDIETTGQTKQHGPVSATPQAGVLAPPPPSSGGGGSESSGGSPASRITYGDPSQNALRVVRRGPHQVVLELVTEGFTALPQADGSVRIEVTGFEEVSLPGSPSIPAKRTWVEAVAGRRVRLDGVRALEVAAFTGLKPVPAGSPEIVVGRDGTVRAGVRRRREGTAFHQAGLYPEEAARVVEAGFQGEVKKALLELSPLRWDPASQQLLLARRLVVRVVFSGVEPSERSLEGSRGRRHEEKHATASGTVLARLLVRGKGLYGLSFEEVLGTQRRGVSVSKLRLSRQGEAVAFHVEPDMATFGPGSVLYFVSEGSKLNPYGEAAVYELELASGGAVMPGGSAFPSGAAVSFYRKLSESEVNRTYQSALLEARDLWLWEGVISPGTKSYPFTLTALASSTEPSHLKVFLQGASDFEAAPDHHVRVSVNGVVVVEASWDGKLPQEVEADLGTGLLNEGANQLRIENVGDTGAAYSYVFLDKFHLSYPRRLEAEGGVLSGSFSQSGTADVMGLGAGALVIDTTDNVSKWLRGAVATASALSFAVEAGRSYLAVASDSVLKPEVKKPALSGLRSPENRADYLLIAPQEFLVEAEPLLERRRNQGLVAKAVAVEEVYQEFGHGETRPEAVKEFISYAYHHWQAPSVRYVVLFGDGTYDFKNYLRTGRVNRVVPRLVRTSYMWTASDPSYVAVNGEDVLPDLAIGRLSAASVAEARVLVGKVLAFEDAGLNFSGPAVLVSDNADVAGNFELESDEIGTMLADREVEKIYLRDLGASAVRPAVIDAFNRGAGLMSYVGHGGVAVWASENVFNNLDVASLGPQSRQPLLLTMNCLNGYFHGPTLDSLSEVLVKAEGKGAVAAFSPTGLSVSGPAHEYEKALIRELTSGRHERLGDAILAAQAAYADTGAMPDLLSIYHLLGDPALKLR